MNINNQKIIWIVDAVLFGGLICAFFMDETGLPFHQWLGFAVGILSNYHLLSHWGWVKSVAEKIFAKTNGRSRAYFVIDAVMVIGITTIVATGIAMSTWLDLTLANYIVWKTVHITASIVTLSVTLLKIGLHWKWIVKNAQRFSFRPVISQPQLAVARIPVAINDNVGRREFLKMMGVVGAATLLVSVKAFKGLEDQGAAVSQTQVALSEPIQKSTTQSEITQSQSESTTSDASSSSTAVSEINAETVTRQSENYAAVIESQSSASCVSPCARGCLYPGHCHQYMDSNGNGRCDNGECA